MRETKCLIGRKRPNGRLLPANLRRVASIPIFPLIKRKRERQDLKASGLGLKQDIAKLTRDMKQFYETRKEITIDTSP